MINQHRAFVGFVRALTVSKGDPISAEAYLKSQGRVDERRVVQHIKALVNPIASGALPYGSEPLDLAGYLRPRTIIGRLEGLVSAPMMTRLVRVTGAPQATFVQQGSPIPARSLQLSSPQQLLPKTIASIGVISNELARSSDPAAEDLIAADFTAGIILEADSRFADPANGGDAANPASVFNGAPSIACSGSSVAAIDADLQALIGLMIAAGTPLDAGAWLMSRRTFTFLSLVRSTGALAYPSVSANKTLLGMPIIDTSAIEAQGSPQTTFIGLLDARQIIVSNGNETSIEPSKFAAVQLSDTPASGPQPLVSLWQMGLTAFRVSWVIDWARRYPNAAAYIAGVPY